MVTKDNVIKRICGNCSECNSCTEDCEEVSRIKDIPDETSAPCSQAEYFGLLSQIAELTNSLAMANTNINTLSETVSMVVRENKIAHTEITTLARFYGELSQKVNGNI